MKSILENEDYNSKIIEVEIAFKLKAKFVLFLSGTSSNNFDEDNWS